ncbi:MAG: hypothetical protein UY48_C0049G0008 [Candidatus Gottesmanbacteria bacterium GW2011_GWB1_49_7]|uniref:DOD-type homing endonuclease domain-containing protein n=1 Tax=Candidatus Gottesmanbacteria bacterium GW2011_GWB1_49_7 TaxID=1618448 RepID=A0A0G1VUQ5_9BACT|nr:MAG: hypothetical protein UY48_C0049G0008 [Candidatus Gottesmanbacteria bacterium GW2011_GWB1_49_7]
MARKKRDNEWSAKDIAYLEKHYTDGTHKVLLKRFPNRTWESIMCKARTMGFSGQRKIRMDEWENWEIQYLKDNYTYKDKKTILGNLNHRTWAGILQKATSMGLVRTNFWVKSEIVYLIENYETEPIEDLLKKFPGRTWSAIQLKATRNGAPSRSKGGEHSWAKWEIDYLRKHYAKERKEIIMLALAGRTWASIHAQAHLMGATGRHKPKEKGGHSWAKWEDEYILQNYMVESGTNMKIALPDRTWVAIKGRARTILGLKRPQSIGSRKYSANHDFFKTWSHDMAYILGFMYADGNLCIHHRKSCNGLIYTVNFTQKHPAILYEIKNKLKYSGTIYFHEIIDKYGARGVHNLTITSQTMFEDLKNLGVQERKSLIMAFPTCVPDEFMGDFIRGYFDGDGCVRHLSQTHLDCHFCSGSKEYLIGLENWLRNEAYLSEKEVKLNKNFIIYYITKTWGRYI